MVERDRLRLQASALPVWQGPADREVYVLDVGAGRGIASLLWALRVYEITALEPDPSDLVGNGV
jgi:tRNA1(Val) A37 N6-methylase TrmN6